MSYIPFILHSTAMTVKLILMTNHAFSYIIDIYQSYPYTCKSCIDNRVHEGELSTTQYLNVLSDCGWPH